MKNERTPEGSSYRFDAPDLLTREQEQSLGLRILEGDTAAMDELAKANMLFVIKLARHYSKITGVPADDLIQEGYMKGLREAARKFNARMGYKFITYAAKWVRNAMIKYVKEKSRLIRLPAYTAGRADKLRKKEAIVLTESNAEISDEDIIRMFKCADYSAVRRIRSAMNVRIRSLYQPIVAGDRDGLTYEDTLRDEKFVDPQTLLESFEIRAKVRAGLARANLNEEEREVLAMRFGLRGGKPRAFDQIAETVGMDTWEVKLMEKNIFKKLRPVLEGLNMV